MRAIVGHSEEVDAKDAAKEVLAQCTEQLGGQMPKAGMVFMSVDYEQSEVLQLFRQAWPELPLIGGSSDGEVSSRGGFSMDSVVLTLFCGDDFEVAAGLGRDLSADVDRAVGQALEGAAQRGRPAFALTTFAPSADATAVLDSLNQAIEQAGCPVLGGLTGDHREFSRMSEFFGDEVLHDSLPILFFYGDLHASWGVGSGWFPIGDAYEVTASQGAVVREIAGEQALSIYARHYGGVLEGTLGEYPLAVYTDGPDGPWVLRAVMGADEDDGSVRFAGTVPEGSFVRMTQVLPEGILSGTTESVRQAVERYPGSKPELALLFTCAARKWVLGSRAESEVGLAQESLPEALRDVALSGLYVYGEIAPPEPGLEPALHNETCITVLIGGQ